MRRWIAVPVAVAGVWLLVGPGWGLLAAAALIAFTPTPTAPGSAARWAIRARSVRTAVRVWTARQWRWIDRQRLAALAMPVGVAAIGVGLGMAVAPGLGLAAAGVCVAGLSLAADRAA
jgi:hypothetical protein